MGAITVQKVSRCLVLKYRKLSYVTHACYRGESKVTSSIQQCICQVLVGMPTPRYTSLTLRWTCISAGSAISAAETASLALLGALRLALTTLASRCQSSNGSRMNTPIMPCPSHTPSHILLTRQQTVLKNTWLASAELYSQMSQRS